MVSGWDGGGGTCTADCLPLAAPVAWVLWRGTAIRRVLAGGFAIRVAGREECLPGVCEVAPSPVLSMADAPCSDLKLLETRLAGQASSGAKLSSP